MNRDNQETPVLTAAALAQPTAMQSNQELPSLDVDRIFRL